MNSSGRGTSTIEPGPCRRSGTRWEPCGLQSVHLPRSGRESAVTRRIQATLFAFSSATLIGNSPTTYPVETYSVPLTSDAVTNMAHPLGGTGDPSGSGSVELKIDPNSRLVCYDFRLSVGSEPMMAHINLGATHQVGAPVVTLFTGTQPRLSDCAPSTHSQLAEINADPSHYYVSVDTTGNPDGAVRGQL